MSISKEPVVTILNTALPAASPSDVGQTQVMKFPFLKLDVPLRLSISLGSGDTVIFEGKLEAADSFVECHIWTGGDEEPVDIYVPLIWRVRRTVDGGVGESVVKAENTHTVEFVEEDA